MTAEQKKAALFKNGITSEDLKRSHDEGYKLGVETSVATCYAAFCLALKEKFHFGQQRLMRALLAADEHVVMTLDNAELIEKVFKETGIQLNFAGTLPEDRILEAVKNDQPGSN